MPKTVEEILAAVAAQWERRPDEKKTPALYAIWTKQHIMKAGLVPHHRTRNADGTCPICGKRGVGTCWHTPDDDRLHTKRVMENTTTMPGFDPKPKAREQLTLT